VCIGTSGPAGTDMITGLYAAIADSVPILCITGQAPRARLLKEDFQAVDIESIAKPVTQWAVTVWAVTVHEPALVPRVFHQAFHVMRPGRPGPVLIDLPVDVQSAETEFDIDTYVPLAVYRPTASRAQIEKALAMLNEAARPLLVASGGIINADASDLLVEFAEVTGVPVVPTLMGWGTIPASHPLMAGMAGLQTSLHYGNATMLASDLVLGIGNRWANRHTGSTEVCTKGRTFVHVDIEPTRIGRVFMPDYGIVSDAKVALDLFVAVANEWKAAGRLTDGSAWAGECAARKATMLHKSHFEQIPIKTQRVYEEMNRAFGPDTTYVTTIGLSQIAAAQFLRVEKPRHWINAGQAGPLGWTLPAALGVVATDPGRDVIAISGDYDFQFLIEELAVGTQFRLPYLHIVVNNSYLGLTRQAQRGFDMDDQVQLAFDNLNAPELAGAGVDHVAVAPGLGCKAVRVTDAATLQDGIAAAGARMREHRVPVVIEAMLERVTNIPMGTEIDGINEFEPVAASLEDATAQGTMPRNRR
jgi:tartronate-semialdehyde synthase